MIKEILQKAEANNLNSLLITFDPHPVEIFAPDKKNFLISPFKDKIYQLKKNGCQNIVVLKFDRDFSVLTAEDFLKKYILEYKNQISELVLGHDFSFGADRQGNFEFAKDYLSNYGINVTQLKKFSDVDVSSSIIRNELNAGKVENVSNLLGRNFFIDGIVIKGEGRGKKIGIPTANINISPRLSLIHI